MAVMARLGVWQLDRREQRIASNTALMKQLAQPPLALNEAALPTDLAQLEDRQAMVRGTYDLERQVALTQQHWFDLPGFHLITPLRIEGREEAVLVDRGWIPAEELAPENWPRYDVQEPVVVTGYVQLSQTLPRHCQVKRT
jgi:surfeit locus 1 family protein